MHIVSRIWYVILVACLLAYFPYTMYGDFIFKWLLGFGVGGGIVTLVLDAVKEG